MSVLHALARYEWAIGEAIILALAIAELAWLRIDTRRFRAREAAKRQETSGPA
ncbi:MAG: hypothetical protein ACP5NI_04875 [Acetobacteraceae bacterium]